MIWIAAAAVILVLALVFGMSLLAYAMYALLAVILISRYVTRRWAGDLSATREASRLSASVGDTVAVVVTIENQGKLPVAWVLLEDLLPRDAIMFDPPCLKVTGRRVQLSMLAPRAKKQLLYQLTCNRRGYFQLGPVVLETGDLFGLHRRFRVAAEPHFLMVLPKVIPLAGYELSSKRPIGEVRMSYRLYEDPTRIAGVRAYQRGDAMNRIHWRASARTGELHSKIYEPSTVAGATILMDFHRDSHPRRDEPFRSELAITAAASIANAVYLMDQQIGLVTNGRDAADRIRTEGWAHDYRSRDAAKRAAEMQSKSDRLRPLLVPTRRGPDQFVAILETLARMELTDGLPLPQLIEETASRMPRDATVVAILARGDETSAIALSNLRRRGFAITVVLNLFDRYEYSRVAGYFQAEGIETRHLKDEDSIVDICRQYALR
ncbi:MAG TPA: DUF58 domain-containing protein [Pirellulaceae bacterium]|nr:DUF58 domain-containing protein [Pirellulaceae bacterium]